ncbi:hypothetical protein [Streptomyces sp. NPDC001978]|uniref:hypothetical protein n=1 Tax=Streptomyces sp. NPDC001978 TaxID=3364627 RepID=UPI0036B59157
MATLACVYDAEPAVRRPHDVIAPPGGRHGNRPLRPGPVARGKWLSGSVADDPATVIGRAFDQAEYRDAGHRRPWVVLVDGAVHRLELVQQEAARRDAEISIVIDLVHVLDVWSAAWCFHESGWLCTWRAAPLVGEFRHRLATSPPGNVGEFEQRAGGPVARAAGQGPDLPVRRPAAGERGEGCGPGDGEAQSTAFQDVATGDRVATSCPSSPCGYRSSMRERTAA